MALFVQEYGSENAKTLIILHGLLGTSDNWHGLSAKYAQAFRVLVPDLANHGRSPHSRVFNYDAMADDVLAMMHEKGVEQAAVLGHSMGGKVAMRLALDYPQQVEQLLVSDISPRMYPRGHDAIFDAMFKLPLNQVVSRKWADDFLKPLIPNDGVRLFILKNLTRDSTTGEYYWRPNLEILFEQYDAIREAFTTGTYTGPSLFIRGGHSDYIAAADEPLIRERFPNAQFSTIEHAGHWIHADQPDAFFQVTMAFLAGH